MAEHWTYKSSLRLPFVAPPGPSLQLPAPFQALAVLNGIVDATALRDSVLLESRIG